MSAVAGRALAVAIAVWAVTTPALAGAAVEATVKTGRWHGVKWEFRAGAWRDGSYCVAMLIRDRENGRACGNVRGQGGIGYIAAVSRPLPDYVIGPVVTTARSVRIEFFDRAPLRLSTIRAPRTLQGGMRFFMAIASCPSTPRSFVARDGRGRVVARFVVRHRAVPMSVC
jgi:hypothetical protein